MIKKILTNTALWGLVLLACAGALVLDFLGFIEPFSEIWVNVIRVAMVLSFIIVLGSAARH
jgi:hypothetical protein